MSNTLRAIHQLGQSVWIDNLSRGMLDAGELRRLIALGVMGITSNPTIFLKSITSGVDYAARLAKLVNDTRDPMALYEGLVLPDIADAAEILRPVYESSSGTDGYVSLEVSPRLAYDTRGTIEEARRHFRALGRPNVMIKVPATEEGIPAIETLIGEGINVNVTLIFGLGVYERVMSAYLSGLERLDAAGGSLGNVASVASFFVSRVDSAVDKMLEKRKAQGSKVDGLLGRAAIANAKLAYERFKANFRGGARFERLRAKGARVQRPLWASTSTKNPVYRDTMYVDDLIGPDTVNTMPPQTIEATLDHGQAATTITSGLIEARTLFSRLADLDIDIDSVTEQLRREGVELFAASFEELLNSLRAKLPS